MVCMYTTVFTLLIFQNMFREPLSVAISIGFVFAVAVVVQFLMFAIMLRFGAYMVALPIEHRFHTNFLNILV